MKKIVFAIAILLVSMSFTTSDWMMYRNIDGRFKVLTRGNFEEKLATFETALGTIQSHTFVYQPKEKEENLIYMVMYYDFPEGGMHSDSMDLLKDFFDETVKKTIADTQGVLIYENDLEHQSYPARQWRIHYPDNQAAIRSRAFIVKNRFYMLQTISMTDVEQNNTTDFFINSFKVLGES